MAQSRTIVLIPDTRTVLKDRHHLCISIVKSLQLRIVAIFAGSFKPIRHLTVIDESIVCDHGVRSAVEGIVTAFS